MTVSFSKNTISFCRHYKDINDNEISIIYIIKNQNKYVKLSGSIGKYNHYEISYNIKTFLPSKISLMLKEIDLYFDKLNQYKQEIKDILPFFVYIQDIILKN